MAQEPVIEADRVVAQYGEKKVLKGVSLAVDPGEIVVIMGRSGCGKTTLLRHLMGLKEPTAGQVRVGGDDIYAMSRREYTEFCRSMGVLFQSGALFDSLTVGDNVAFPLREHSRLAEPVIDITVRMKLNQVGLEGTEDMMPDQLSGGMRKRAALARALALDPGLVFLDEPTTRLDPIIAGGIDELIVHLRDTYGVTMVVVSHDIETGMNVADRIAVLQDGEMAMAGPPEQIKASDNPQVRQFLARRPRPRREAGSTPHQR